MKPLFHRRKNSCANMLRLAAFFGLTSGMAACGTENDGADTASGRDVYVDGAHHFVPDSGYVPDSTTAAQIARAVLAGIYGDDRIQKQQPLQARLVGETWTVEGTLPDQHVGGVGIVVLSKRDGRIIRVSHGQ